MSAFSPEWLGLREPADHVARDPGLTQTLAHWAQRRGRLEVLDLGAGTGSNLRYLAPRLGVDQHWRLLDYDAALLAALPARLLEWAARQGYGVLRASDGLRIQVDRCRVDVDWSRCDLASLFGAALPLRPHLVTASALLDLASADWVQGLARWCHARDSAALCVLTYDGRIQWRPSLAGDTVIAERLNRHQVREKGLGLALGPAAAARAVDAFETLGRGVQVAPSDWHLGPESLDLQEALATGWVRAAIELDPMVHEEADTWLRSRTEAFRRADAWLRVGHQDLLALPCES
ncbi:class I SAM-dependent methyltransferase [Thiocystis violacea]|uniref:class I SAM-dependent methyltransferase n=1 Tax=Thiocystis violacea TaxID=13725 RepID=UPI00190680D7|nr:class I SAM-dependent methyltransferase [Thiocystis violacea]MBK1722938.1 hypothetical protein [Thiocystis violacea]